MSPSPTPADDPSMPWGFVPGTKRAPSRWRDWRTYVGGLGRILVALGVLILAFVGYQLWGTGIQEARSQRELSRRLDAQLATTTTKPPATTAVPTTPPVTAPPASTLPQPTAPGTATVPTTARPATTTPPATTAPPVTAPPTTAVPADGSQRPAYNDGDPVARLEIPRIRLNKVVVMGVQIADLRKGPGSYPSTPLPGEIGNAGVAGHRTTYGAPFERLDELKPGDEIIATSYAGRFVYRVTDTRIVKPADTSVLAPSTDTRLTLTTCHPRYSTAQRLVVTAVLDPAASAQPLPPPTPAPPVTAAPDVTDAPTTAAPAGDGGSGQTVATSATTAPSTAAGPATTAPPATLAPPATTVPDAQATDQLSRGWFSDPDAWPPVALWGLALTAVALGAWGISRAAKRNWVGALLGIVPFVVVLYFFFENVARLLPPNL